MKKRFFTVLVSVGLVLSVALLVGCADNKPQVEENVTVNQAQASVLNADQEEFTSVNPDDAIDSALKHAGVDRENAVLYGAPTLDNDNGKAHYDIEFAYNGFEYDYEVAVEDGVVLKAEKEAERTQAPVTQKATENNETSVKKENTTKANNKNNNGYISVEAAKQKALENADVKAEDAFFVKAHYDYDDRVPHYEVEFHANGYEYEYEVRASDGAVLNKDVEREREPVKTTATSNNYVSAEKAKTAAFNHAKVKVADVKFAKTELDRDDRVVHYDVEFVAGKYEYEYEVNAENGKVLSYNKEFND